LAEILSLSRLDLRDDYPHQFDFSSVYTCLF
jgi:hypothetical protein